MSAISVQSQDNPSTIITMPQPEPSETLVSQSTGSYTLVGRVIENWRQCVHTAVVAFLVTAFVISLLQGALFVATVLGITTTYHFTLLQELVNTLNLKKINIQLDFQVDKLREASTKLDCEVMDLKSTNEQLQEQLEKMTKEAAIFKMVSEEAKNTLDSLINDVTGNLNVSNGVVDKLLHAQRALEEQREKGHIFLNENTKELNQVIEKAKNNNHILSDTLKSLLRIQKENELAQEKCRREEERLSEVRTEINLATENLKKTQEECTIKQKQMQEEYATQQKRMQEAYDSKQNQMQEEYAAQQKRMQALQDNFNQLQHTFIDQLEKSIRKLCNTTDDFDTSVKQVLSALFQQTFGSSSDSKQNLVYA